MLLLPIILLLEEFALFRDVALVILEVLGFHQFVADPALGFQHRTLPPVIAAAKRPEELVFIAGQVAAQLLVTQLFELALQGARSLQHEAPVSLEVLNVVLVQELLLKMLALVSDASEFGLLDDLAVDVRDLQGHGFALLDFLLQLLRNLHLAARTLGDAVLHEMVLAERVATLFAHERWQAHDSETYGADRTLDDLLLSVVIEYRVAFVNRYIPLLDRVLLKIGAIIKILLNFCDLFFEGECFTHDLNLIAYIIFLKCCEE